MKNRSILIKETTKEKRILIMSHAFAGKKVEIELDKKNFFV